MKKVFTAMLALSVLFAAQFHAAAAAGQPTFTLASGISAARGERVIVPMTVSGNPGFTSVGFVVTYNPNVLEIAGVSAAQPAMPLNSQFVLTTAPGTQWIHFINTSLMDWSENGTLAYITFYVKTAAPAGSSPVYLSFTSTPDGTPANGDGDTYWDARTVSGSVTVSDQSLSGTVYPVIYDLNGGTGTAAETDKAAGQTFQILSAANINAPDGKQFKQWNTSPDGTGIMFWPGETLTMPDSPLTLYAIWEDIIGDTGEDTGSGIDVVHKSSETNVNKRSERLPQTGLLYWPIPVLNILGVPALILGGVLLGKKKQ